MYNNNTKSTRNLNGYRVLYRPDHPAAMTNANWKGYVYEHICVAEDFLGRRLREDEVVHHLNGKKDYNLRHNLLVLQKSQHSRLHNWLEAGAPGFESARENGENSGKSSFIPDFKTDAKYCKICDSTLQSGCEIYCGDKCHRLARRKVTRPSKESLQTDIDSLSMEDVGRKHGVSSNAVRKWLKSYGMKKTILSRAKDTSLEGAETSGEVKPS